MIPHVIRVGVIARQEILYLVAGDEAPSLQVSFEGLDLSTYTSVVLKARRPDGSSFSHAMTPVGVTDPESATVDFDDDDLIPGDTFAEFQFTESGKVFRLPEKYLIIFRVRSTL